MYKVPDPGKGKYSRRIVKERNTQHMNLNTIHHIAIIVSDYNLSKDFYVNKLGFSIIRENYRPERNDWKLDLQCGNIELEIFGVSNPPARVSNPEACGLRHLAFRVHDVKATVKYSSRVDKPSNWCVYSTIKYN